METPESIYMSLILTHTGKETSQKFIYGAILQEEKENYSAGKKLWNV